MLYAFMADIHGNIVALDAVLAHLDQVKPDHIVNLGDIVGYAARPSECIARIRERGIETIVGNHDQAATGQLDISYFNLEAQESVQWTIAALSKQDLTFLRGLPLTIGNDFYGVSHGSFREPAEFEYVLSLHDAAYCFGAEPYRVAFIAHSHVPVGFLTDGNELWAVMSFTIPIPQRARAIINVGSVGQPRDGDPRASFVLFDTGTMTAQIVRIRYDIDAAAAQILETTLPKTNAYRLFLGR
jgi:diadenosine tetraphosphatase ApaH/serine/threonine PP2A family protein phosphatase